MAADNLQAQRFELKYLIPEEIALKVRQFASAYLEIDEYGATMPNLSYPVHSLYVDSPGLDTYWHTINGDKNRYKLRIRYYNEKPESPVFFEIKARCNSIIIKKRCGVRRSSVSSILSGQMPRHEEILSREPKQFYALQKFCQLMHSLNARPQIHVFYMREAWISTVDNSIRVTLDRDVQIEPDPTARLKTYMVNPVRPFGRMVILELKFTNRFPDWFKELVRCFGLTQCGAAKYAEGITTIGEQKIMNAFAFDGESAPVKMGASAERVEAAAPAEKEPVLVPELK
jgi:hypothetical protein